MAPLPERVRQLIESGPLAHLVTLNGDGSPQVTIVWIGLEGDEIVSGHLYEHRKIRNVRRDPTVALSFEAPGANEIGMRHYVVLYGHARSPRSAHPSCCSAWPRFTSVRACPSLRCPTRRQGTSRE